MFLRMLGACVMLVAGTMGTRAADLPIPTTKPAARPDAPPTPESRKQLLDEFRQFLRERGQPH